MSARAAHHCSIVDISDCVCAHTSWLVADGNSAPLGIVFMIVIAFVFVIIVFVFVIVIVFVDAVIYELFCGKQ
jgi:hypothetical protein